MRTIKVAGSEDAMSLLLSLAFCLLVCVLVVGSLAGTLLAGLLVVLLDISWLLIVCLLRRTLHPVIVV